MNAKTGLSNRHQLQVFLCLWTIVFFIVLSFPWPGFGAAHSRTRISVKANNEPLHHLLAGISRATGYSIEITKGWKEKLITTELKEASLEESLQTIIRAMGRPSYVMIVDDNARKVEIRIFDTSAAGIKDVRGRDVVTGNDFPHGGHSPFAQEGHPPVPGHAPDMEGNRQPHRPDLGIELPY